MTESSTLKSDADVHPVLSGAELQSFRENGFLTVREISPASEVANLRTVFRRLFSEKVGWEQGAQFDMVGTDDQGAPAALPQILDPEQFAPELQNTVFRARAFAMARQLIGAEAMRSYEHAIFKPPQRGAATPWHQDEAFRQRPELDYASISFWMPLQPATEQNGCLRYIPGSNRGEVLSHKSPNDDPRVHALECDGEFDAASAVTCPLEAGDACIHDSRTLHGAGPNTTLSERFAYVLTFKTPSRPGSLRREFPWQRATSSAREIRREAWRSRGWLGAIKAGVRRYLSAGRR